MLNGRVSEPTDMQEHTLVPQVRKQLHLFYFNNEAYEVETALSAYATSIFHWAERETPWRISCPSNRQPSRLLFDPQKYSILQHFRAAQKCFLSGRPHHGGEMLRQAFLGIERSVSIGLDVEAIWDYCLAVPHSRTGVPACEGVCAAVYSRVGA